MAPKCTNCGSSDLVWAPEVKSGTIGSGSISLRGRGELPLGARICRQCGHAELFLHDLSVVRNPSAWRPGEFTIIQATGHHHHGQGPAEGSAPAPTPT
ncbi:MAG: hypothetical protein WAN40_04790, partial [Thermoplasmata archaeon]